MKSWLVRIVFGLLVAGSSTRATAHGDHAHVMGLIKAIDVHSITVETADKHEAVVGIDPSTKIEKDGAPATMRDFAVGQRIVVHAKKEHGGLVAVVIKGGVEPKLRARDVARDER